MFLGKSIIHELIWSVVGRIFCLITEIITVAIFTYIMVMTTTQMRFVILNDIFFPLLPVWVGFSAYLVCMYVIFFIILYLQSPYMGLHNLGFVKLILAGLIPTRGIFFFIFSFSFSGNKTKSGIEFRHSTRKTSKIQRKLGNVLTLVLTLCPPFCMQDTSKKYENQS